MKRRDQEERRRNLRAHILGRAVVYLDDWSAREYRVENLSTGGALLSGGPQIPIGREVRVVLRIGAIPAIKIAGRAVWHEAGTTPRTAVSFVGVDASMEDLIQDNVLASIVRGVQRPRCVSDIEDLAPLLP